jgi:Lrp/AsnC family transcriptional regulator, leucine-responsive regulatory protein
MSPVLGEPDLRLLRALQRDGRMSNQELAEACGMSASACWRRVKALEEAGVIAGYTALVAPDRAGYAFAAIVHITLQRHERAHVDQFIEAVSRRAEVLECFATTGEADYHLRVVSPDKEAYNRFLDDFLFRLPGIAHVRTNVVLKDIKVTTRLPL